jgi:hypothetical protein
MSDPIKEPELYSLVKAHMVHGPCGLTNRNSPCMRDGKCSKYYPKKFQSVTIVDQEGIPVIVENMGYQSPFTITENIKTINAICHSAVVTDIP